MIIYKIKKHFDDKISEFLSSIVLLKVFLFINKQIYLSLESGKKAKTILWAYLNKLLKLLSYPFFWLFVVKNQKKQTISIKLSDEKKILFDKNYNGIFDYWYGGGVEKNLVKIVKSIMDNKSTLIDVGANVGIVSILTSLFYNDAKIYAIEPNNASYRELIINAKLNNSILNPIKTALYSKKGSMKLHVAKQPGLTSLKKPTRKDFQLEKTTKIKTETLDNITSKNRIKKIKLIKIDVEGAELFVLKGGSRKTLPITEYLVIESLQINTSPFGYSSFEIVKFLNKKGFIVFTYNTNDLKLANETNHEGILVAVNSKYNNKLWII